MVFLNQTEDGLWLQVKENQIQGKLEKKLRAYDKKIAALMERADAIAAELDKTKVLEMRVLTRHLLTQVTESHRKKKEQQLSRRMLKIQRQREDDAFKANSLLLPSPSVNSFVVEQEVNVTLFDLEGQRTTMYVMCVRVCVCVSCVCLAMCVVCVCMCGCCMCVYVCVCVGVV